MWKLSKMHRYHDYVFIYLNLTVYANEMSGKTPLEGKPHNSLLAIFLACLRLYSETKGAWQASEGEMADGEEGKINEVRKLRNRNAE